jgi:hypothetical protein
VAAIEQAGGQAFTVQAQLGAHLDRRPDVADVRAFR